MLCITLKERVKNCGSVTGGVSDVAIFDPSDYNFTQGAKVNGAFPPYSAISARTGAETAKMYTVTFQQDEGEYTVKQSKKGCSSKYEFEWILQLPDLDQGLTNFLETLDEAGCCCGIGIITRLNSGRIFVAGEKYVNNSTITRFTVAQDGSDGGSGKLFDDFNGINLHLKASYKRNWYEYSGTWDSILALISGVPLTFDSSIDFATSATPAAVAGVGGTASATDAEQEFEFNAITPRTGTPQNMNIKVGGTLELVVTFTSDYTGQSFKYTDKAGVAHNGVFTNGDVNF